MFLLLVSSLFVHHWKSSFEMNAKEPRSHLISTPVTTPTLNLSSRGISCEIYGILQEKTDAKVYLAIVKYQRNHNIS